MAKFGSYSAVLVALVVGLSLVACTMLTMRAMTQVRGTQSIVRVTGSARKAIKSDLIIWTGRATARAATVADAYKTLKAGVASAQAFLTKGGLPATEVETLPITTRTLYAPLPKAADGSEVDASTTYRQVMGYELSQSIRVRSEKVDLVDKLSRQVTELVGGGIDFESNAPEYWYTKLGDLKVEILADAAKDARNRAEQIATNSGCSLGAVRYCRQGVMRIIPAYSTSEPDEMGSLDTSALDKEAVAIVEVGYAVR
ncbi:MAG: SIMPL domain-containing protein [Armatimonadota bacterium]